MNALTYQTPAFSSPRCFLYLWLEKEQEVDLEAD